MQKFRPLILFFALVLFAIGCLWLGFRVSNLLRGDSGPRVYGTATVLQQVQALAQLVTVKYVMEKVVVIEDAKWYPGGESRVLMLAHGIVKAGVDFGKLKPEDLHVSGTKITIRLPAAQITDTYLDERETRVIERTTGLLRLFDKDLEQTARQTAVDDIRRAARASGIIKDANERARAQLKNLFNQMGFTEVEFLEQ